MVGQRTLNPFIGVQIPAGQHTIMCRNIKTLFNFEPPATETEIKDASLQFVRKLTGFKHPSKANEQAFNDSVEKIAEDIKVLFSTLTTNSASRNREVEANRARAKALKRFPKDIT